MNYWKECIEEAFCEVGIKATEAQKKSIIEAVEGAHENYSMAMGHECIPNPLQADVDRAEAKIKTAEKEGEVLAERWKLAFCRTANLNPDDVYISNGEILKR